MDNFQNKNIWEKIQRNGMTKDYSWRKSAEKYIELYRLAKKKRG
jgi:starch synthase